MSLRNNYSIFQKWIILQLYDGDQQNTTELLRNCCDTAITESLLVGDTIGDQLAQLVTDGILRGTGNRMYQITDIGVLYARIHLFKPITDLVDRSDFNRIYQNLEEGPLRNILEEEYNGVNTDKTKLTNRIREYALNHMAPYLQFTQSIINFISKINAD